MHTHAVVSSCALQKLEWLRERSGRAKRRSGHTNTPGICPVGYTIACTRNSIPPGVQSAIVDEMCYYRVVFLITYLVMRNNDNIIRAFMLVLEPNEKYFLIG